jgi:biopolymer transport protein ExbB/TolQ
MTLLMNRLADAALGTAATPGLADRTARYFQDGGPFMLVNLLWLALALGLAAERLFTLVFRLHLSAGPFMEQVNKLVVTGNTDRAVKLCAAAPQAPLARVVRAALLRAHRGEGEVAKAVEEALAESTPRMRARLAWLPGLASVATLVGLVGTMFGIIGAFEAYGDAPVERRQALLSEGVSRAMADTAFALSVAVLCIVFHLGLNSYARGMADTVKLQALRLQNLLARRAAGEPELDGGEEPARRAS